MSKLYRSLATGKLLLDPTTMEVARQGAPSSCPGGLEASYSIQGYVDGDIAACIECSGAAYTTPWDGIFNDLVSSCRWEGTQGNVIDGRFIPLAFPPVLGLDTTQAIPRWYIIIYCHVLIPTPSDVIIWKGVKSVGDNPVGVYTRTEGCDVTTALSIVATV